MSDKCRMSLRMKPRNCNNYTQEAMREAYESVKTGKYTGRQAAAEYKVPYGTLNKKLSGRAPAEAFGGGRPPEINMQNEKRLAEYLRISGKYGFGYSRRELRDFVTEFVIKENIKTKWTNGIPTHEWLKSFLKRNPEIEVRTDEPLSQRSPDVDLFIVQKFYDGLECLCANENVMPQDGGRFYSVSEITFPRDLEVSHNSPSCSKCSSNCKTLNPSVLLCISADGSKLPPLIVFQGRCVLSNKATSKTCPGTMFTGSSRGWLEGTIFCHWFENIFIPQIPDLETRQGQSVVLFYDGNSLHINVRMVSEAVKHKVILVNFPPSIADQLEPLNRTCLTAIELAWDTYHNFEKRNLATAQKLFGEFLGLMWNDHFGMNIIQNAFEFTGLYPCNRSKFNTHILVETGENFSI